MRLVLAFCAIALLWCAPAKAQRLAIDLANDHIDITTGFTGSELILYGSSNQKEDLAIVVHGPKKNVTVWRKGRFLGAWMNKDSMTFRDVPIFYDYALSKNIDEEAMKDLAKNNGIGINALLFKPDEEKAKKDQIFKFQEALIRTKQEEGLFPLTSKDVVYLGNELFKVRFEIPPNVPKGIYHVYAYRLESNKVVERAEKEFRVGQIGKGADVLAFAHRHSLAYGGLCVLLAVIAGWLVNMMYRRD